MPSTPMACKSRDRIAGLTSYQMYFISLVHCDFARGEVDRIKIGRRHVFSGDMEHRNDQPG
jgi:hypothetical protein